MQLVPQILSLEVKQPRREYGGTSPYSAEVKRGGVIPPLYMWVLHPVACIDQYDNHHLAQPKFCGCIHSVFIFIPHYMFRPPYRPSSSAYNKNIDKVTIIDCMLRGSTES
jgi:hypothetical protein